MIRRILSQASWKTFLLGIYMWGITALLVYFLDDAGSLAYKKVFLATWFLAMQFMAIAVLKAKR